MISLALHRRLALPSIPLARRWLLCILATLVIGPMPTSASPVGTEPWDTVLHYTGQVGTKSNLALRHAQIPSLNQLFRAGVYQFETTDPPVSRTVQTFCIDPQFISRPPVDIGFDITHLSNAPVNPNGQPPTLSPTQVQAIQRLWFNEIGSAMPTVALGTRAPAFQLALWEIAWETDPNGAGYNNWDVTAGDFYTVTTGTAITDAAAMLTALSGGTNETQLQALVSQFDQDQVVTSMPTPRALLTAAFLGLIIGVQTYRRHHRPEAF